MPGHEVAGVIDDAGSGVTQWKKGQRVGVGWHGGQDGTCLPCRRGNFANCASLKITGLSYDGGYQEYMIAPVEALARMPESLDAAEAAPLLCAGITTFNALRHSGALPSDLVAVQGVGGLGHLGIQFAQKFGYRVAAIGRGPENAALAKKLGASVYAQLESDVVADRRTRNERQDDGGGSDDGSDRGDACSTDFRQAKHSGLAVGNPDRFGRYATVRRADGCAADDREVSAGESRGSIRADDERAGGVSRRPHDVGVRTLDSLIFGGPIRCARASVGKGLGMPEHMTAALALPSEDAALILLFSLVVSGQIKLRRIDGWQTIAGVLSQHPSVAA